MKAHPAKISVVVTSALALSIPAFATTSDGHDSHKHAAAGSESASGHSHEKCEIHGGSVVMTADNHFEVLFTPAEARLYVYDEAQEPVSKLEGVKATLTLTTKESKSEPLPMEYVKADPKAGFSHDYFIIRHDLANAGGNTKATFRVEGLGKTPVEFKSAVVLGEQAVYTCRMHPDVKAEEPGACPKCGMPLHKVEGTEAHEHGEHDAGASGAHDHH